MARVICFRKMDIFTGCLSLSAQQWLRHLLKQSSKTAFREQFHHNVRFYSARRVSLRVKANGVDFHCEKCGSGDHNVLLLPGAMAQQWLRRLLKQSSKTVFREQFHHNVRFCSVRRVSLQVKANGVAFHCEQFGSGDHTVLLLPGAMGGSMTDFNCQLEKMNPEKFTIFGFDPRGYGRSTPPERDWPVNFRHRDAEDAVAVMNTLGQKKFSVLGFSDGGTTGLILAALYQEHVRKLVVWGANAYFTEEDIEIQRGMEDIDLWSAKNRDRYLQVYEDKYFQLHWSNWVKANRSCLTHSKGDICKAELKNITCPTFILHGMKDPLTTAEHPIYLNKHIKNSRLHNFPEGNHHIHMHKADEFNKMVEDFLLE